MVKHTRTICQHFDDKMFECVWPFCGIGAYKDKKIEYVQTFQLIESKNEWLIFGTEGKTWQENWKYPVNIIN